MKYVSPIYEVETVKTEDIICASPLSIAQQLGVAVSGTTEGTNGQSTVTSVTLTDENGKSDGISQDPTNTTATGVSIGIDFGALFG